MDSGPEDITDGDELAQVRSQARRVHVQALVLALALTALSIAVHG